MASKLKGEKILNREISKIFSSFGISQFRLSDDFAYYDDTETVTFEITHGSLTDKLFDEYIEKTFGLVVPYPFIISVLHEIGHHNTLEEYDCAEYRDRVEEIEKEIAKLDISKKKDLKKFLKLEYEYFALEPEYQATKWAVDFFRNNRSECDEMYKKVCSALCEFYKKNGVTEDI